MYIAVQMHKQEKEPSYYVHSPGILLVSGGKWQSAFSKQEAPETYGCHGYILSEKYIASLVYWGTEWGPGCYLIGVGCYDITGHLLS